MKHDFKDPFNAGQLVGMLVMLSFIERNGGISEEVLHYVQNVLATNLQEYFGQPTEDIHLMIDSLVKEIEKI